MSAVQCYEPDGVTPCRYQSVCHESRRRVQALTAPPFGPLRGESCWAYQMLRDEERRPRLPSTTYAPTGQP